MNNHRNHVDHTHVDHTKDQVSLKTYVPLILAFAIIIGFTMMRMVLGGHGIMQAMRDFMGAFFILFGAIKLINLREFAGLFSRYDLLAQALPGYAYAYPFIEIALGLCFLTGRFVLFASLITLILMGMGAIGVARAVSRKPAITCACMGSYVKLPLTTVSLIENILMAAMAAIMLLVGYMG